jgi:diketogulonate reductase-like aldo/keto reductase
MHGLKVMAYSNLGSLSYVSIGLATENDTCLKSPCVLEAAAKYNKTPAQIVLRWAVQRNTVVIPKTTKPERLTENISIFDFALTEDEMNAIYKLNKNERYNDPGKYTEPGMGCFYPIYE